MSIRIALVRAEVPGVLSKTFDLAPDESLMKTTAAALRSGELKLVELADMAAFRDLIGTLGPDEALLCGLPVNPRATRIVTQKALLKGWLDRDRTIARTRNAFHFPEEPAILALDFDGAIFTREEALDYLYGMIPQLRKVPIVWTPSSSSHICRQSDGEDLTGLRGQRFYILLQDGSDIPRVMTVLETLSWAGGHGHIFISKSGQRFARYPIDPALGRPGHLDFVSRPVTGPGLEQRGPGAELIGPPEGAPLDSRRHVPEPDRALLNRAATLREVAYRRAGPESQEIRARWMQERHDAALERGATPEEVASLERALEAHVLGADVAIHVQEPGCEGFRIVSVADLLAEPGRWDGAVTLDPLEPDYRDGSQTGKLFLLGREPRLYSQAHGGQVWRLEAGRPTIVCEPGGGERVTREVLERLSGSGQLFNCGSALVTIEGGHVIELNEHSLALVLGRIIRFLKPNPKGGLTPVDPPVAAVRQILSLGRARNLPRLETLARAPQVAADRSLLDRPGYDPETGIYFLFDRDAFPPLPREATEHQLRAAIRILEAPFELFPLAGHADRTAQFAMILTAALRPCLPTAPMLVTDGAVRGSGKSLHQRALGALSLGRPVPVMPPLRPDDDEEMRKRLLAAIAPQSPAPILLDNCHGAQASPPLCAFLTAPSWTDRGLGMTRLIEDCPTRVLVGMSGNNISIEGDLVRRALICRLDPRMEHACDRSFPFDPVEKVLETHKAMVRAALLLVRAAGRPDLAGRGRLAGFETWDDLVRATVIWCGRRFPDIGFDDPVHQLLETSKRALDRQETAGLLELLHAEFGTARFSAFELVSRALGNPAAPLADALRDLAKGAALPSSKSVGRHLMSLRDRPLSGFCLRARKGRSALEWWIDPPAAAPAPAPDRADHEALLEEMGLGG